MLVAGQRVGPYVVQQLIAVGGTSEVYTVRRDDGAEDAPLLALKLLQAALGDIPALQARLWNEALGLRALDVAGLVPVMDHGSHDGRPYLVLEYMLGGNLSDRARPMKRQSAVTIGAQLARTLALLHARGIVHRDVKPHNVLFTIAGEARLADFGIAKNEPGKRDGTLIPHSTETGVFVGTRAYAAPEQLTNAKEVTPQADVYALGVLLFELLTGALPERGEDSRHVLRGPGTRRLWDTLRAESPQLAALLGRMLSFRPGDRPGASAVAAELEHIGTRPEPRPMPWRGRAAWLAGVSLIALVPADPGPALGRRLDSLYDAFERDLDAGGLAAAEESLTEAAQWIKSEPVPAPEFGARQAVKLADRDRIQGDLRRAARGYEASLLAWRQLSSMSGSPDAHRRRAICANELGDMLLHLGEHAEAIALYREALFHQQILLTRQFSPRPQLAYTQYRIGRYHAERHEVPAAQQALRDAWDLLKGPDDQDDVLLYRSRVAEQLASLTEPTEAMSHARRAYDLSQEGLRRHPASVRYQLAHLRATWRLGTLGQEGRMKAASLEALRSLWRKKPALAGPAHELIEVLLSAARQEPAREDLRREAHQLLEQLERHGQLQGDVHLQTFRAELSALESRTLPVLPTGSPAMAASSPPQARQQK